MDNENKIQEQETLGEDVIRRGEDAVDSQQHLEYIEVLKKIRRRWRTAALTSMLVFLSVILYACGSTKHSDTIVPTAGTPEPTVTAAPPDEADERIEVYEYVIKPDGISPEFTEDVMIPGFEGIAWMDNIEAMLAYADTYSINWIMENGDDNFTAERKTGETAFKSEKPYEFTNNYTTYKISDGSVCNADKNVYQACISILPEERADYAGGVTSIAVVLPGSTSEGDISNGVSAFLENFKGLDWRQEGGQDGSDAWNILDKSREDMAQMLGESFGVQGRVITSSPAAGDIHFLGEGGKTVVESEYIGDGDKIVFITLERFKMGKGFVPAYYSKYLQGNSQFLKEFDSREALVSFLEENKN